MNDCQLTRSPSYMASDVRNSPTSGSCFCDESFYLTSGSPNTKTSSTSTSSSSCSSESKRYDTATAGKQLHHVSKPSAGQLRSDSTTCTVQQLQSSSTGSSEIVNDVSRNWTCVTNDPRVDDMVGCMTQISLKQFENEMSAKQSRETPNTSWMADTTMGYPKIFIPCKDLLSQTHSMTSPSNSNVSTQHRAIIGQHTPNMFTSCPLAQRAMHETFAMNGMHQAWSHGQSLDTGRHASGQGPQSRLTRARGGSGDSWIGQSSRPNYPFPSHIIQQAAGGKEMRDRRNVDEKTEQQEYSTGNMASTLQRVRNYFSPLV